MAFGVWRLAHAIVLSIVAVRALEDLTSTDRLDWEELEDVGDRAAQQLDLILAVKHASEERLEEELHRVSSPASSSYGRYWRLDENFASLLGCRKEAEKIQKYLGTNGTTISEMGDFLRVKKSVLELEALLKLRLRSFRHKASGQIRFAARPWERLQLPDALAQIDFISGLHLPRPKQLRSPRPAVADHGLNQTGNSSKVLVVEARDRGFQVHVLLNMEQARYRQLCSNGQVAATCALRHYDAICTPVIVAGRREYLEAVKLRAEVQEDSCSVAGLNESSVQITCVVVLGPSLGLVNFSPTQLQLQAVFADGSQGAWVTYERLAWPSLSMTVGDLRRMYHVPDGYRNRAAKNSQAVASFFNISASEDDARLFHLAMGMRRQPAARFEGPRGEPGVEGNIDMQWIQAMGNNVPVTYWATPGGDPATAHEPFLEWLLELANSSNPPLVHSLSYGENEEDYSLQYQRRGNLELAKLGLRGVTVLAASGDTGVQGAAQQGGSPPRCVPFAAVWPASSPYITTVGATMVSNHMSDVCNIDRIYAMGSNNSMPFACPETNVGEIVCSTQTGSMITSGGGFSQRFPRPQYQEDAIEEYLSQVNVNRSLFNSTGRGYPDISATGANVPIIFQGRLTMVGGTSASSPIVAGLVALINGERLEAGLPPLGFMNPLLYSSYQRWPEIVQDVRVGNISGTNLLLPPPQIKDCQEGFPALPGWDAASGLGSPNFKEMLAHLVDTRNLVKTASAEQKLVV